MSFLALTSAIRRIITLAANDNGKAAASALENGDG